MEVPDLGSRIPVSEILQSLGTIGKSRVEFKPQACHGRKRIRVMGSRKGEGPERQTGSLGLVVDHLHVVVPVVAADASESDRIVVKGNHRQFHFRDESADIFPVIAGQDSGVHEIREKIQVERMLASVGIFNLSRPLRKVREGRAGWFIPQEIAVQRRMVLDKCDHAVRGCFEFPAGGHHLDSDLLRQVKRSTKILQGSKMREVDVETAVCQFLIPFKSCIFRRNGVPGHDGKFFSASRTALA